MKKVYGIILLGLIVAGCSSKHIVKTDPIIHNSNSAKVIFYRGADTSDKPIMVGVQDRVVGVIKSNQYLETSVCAGSFPIRTTTRVGDKTYSRSAMLNIQNEQTVYVLVDTLNAVAEPKVVSALSQDSITKDKINGTYAINRYAPDCKQYIDISADVLFDFNKATLKPAGEVVLDKLTDTLKLKAVETAKMIIEGYTDRLGSDAYNDRLSLNRAKTVLDYLKMKGIQTPLSPRGMGKRMPVTNGCHGVSPRAKLYECLQPDRRVRIELIGKSHNIVDQEK